ncbi:unnamed protein product [Withania somnifera]
MSTVYVLEPPTMGKVILNTTYGPLDIELWPKEAPKAVRNFVQLCLEGYYDNTIFHRVIKSFLVQGGDPTGTGTGGECIYGGVFPDEFHSRLRFKHRGLVACAGAGSPNSNASQFFMTLDRCDFLDKKHTIFGKVTGDSIYNLITLGEVETRKDDRPVDPPPKILSVEVLWNPFEDIVLRVKPAKALSSGVTTEKKDAKQKATKKLNLLSFGEEAEEEEKELVAVSGRIRSSHDVLDDPRLLKEGKHDQALDSSEGKSTRDVQLTIREALGSKKEASHKESGMGFQVSLDNSDEGEADFDAQMRQQILKRRKELGDPPPKQKLISVDKLSLKRKGIGSDARAEHMASANTDLQLLSGPERERQLLKQKRRGRKGHEEDVLAKLEKFKAGLSAKANESENVGKEEELADWAAVTLKFTPEPGKDKMSRTEDPNDYVVHDPLLEKGKEKFNKMMAKQKRREREWAGKSLT